MSQNLLAHQNKKIAILNRLHEISKEKMVINAVLQKLENSETPVFDICFEGKN